MLDLKKPREFISLNSKVKKSILVILALIALYFGIFSAAGALNNYLFQVYNVDQPSFLVPGR